MLRRSLQAVLVIVAIASLVEGAQGAAPQHHAGKICDYLFGGYGPGPFGRGDVCYGGYASHTVPRHRDLVPSFTTPMPFFP